MLVVLLGALLAPSVAVAQEQQLEPTIAVDSVTTSAAAPAVSATTLQAGQRYLLVVNGTYTESFPTTDGGTFTYFNDGVYCFDENPERPQFGCRARPQIFERTGLILRLGSPGGGSPELLGPYYKKLPGPDTPPPFAASHRYQLSFTAGRGGRLLMSASKATSKLLIRAQRKGAPPPTLRVTCRKTAAGLQVRVTPRQPGIGLRKLVGPRLKVGLVRLPTSKQTAGPTISFRR